MVCSIFCSATQILDLHFHGDRVQVLVKSKLVLQGLDFQHKFISDIGPQYSVHTESNTGAHLARCYPHYLGGRAALRFAATLRGRRCQRSVWQSPPTEISATSLGGPAKTPYRDGTTHVIFERGGPPSLDFIAKLVALAWPAAYEAAHKSAALCSYHPCYSPASRAS